MPAPGRDVRRTRPAKTTLTGVVMGENLQSIDFTSRAPESRGLDVSWIHGSESAKHNTDPDMCPRPNGSREPSGGPSS